MTDWTYIAAYSIGGALLLLMVLGIVLSACLPAIDRWNRGYFITLFSLLLLYVIVLFIDMVIYENPDMVKEESAVIFLEYLFFSFMTLTPVIFLLHCCGESIKTSILFRVAAALWVVYFVMLIIAQFTDIFYYPTPNNKFLRGQWFAFMLVPLVAILICTLVSVIKRRDKLSVSYFVALLIDLIPKTIVLIVYMIYSVDILVSFVIAVCALSMFSLILRDNVEHYLQQQREIANQRAGIMVLQMRPHFICNTMMSIYYLCDQDPQKAKQVTLDFTTYLRKNFTAIASENTIPFTSELEHTRAYLAVEQAQFEDSLFVTFDTPHTMFRVPPLTLQPIVENAVKHGLTASSDSIHISIVTRLTDSASEIIVEDEGPGFSPVDDNEPHIALNNIRQRLELMCKGKLTITSRDVGGMSVKVTIPESAS